MAEGDLSEALRRLMERGWRAGDPTRPDLAGLNDLRERLRRQREELQERYQLRDVLADVRQELEEITAQPLLNYLLALSWEWSRSAAAGTEAPGGKIDFRQAVAA